jgi:hypothetical protein
MDDDYTGAKMPSKKVPKHLMVLLRGSVDAFVNSPIILLPFITIAFVQLFVLEVLYFSPRFPLSAFFNPIVGTLWGAEFTHYPNNILLLPKLFQNMQVLIYICVSSFFIAVAIAIISAINNDRKIKFLEACKETLGQYIHIFAGAMISFGAFLGLYKLYHLSLQAVLDLSSVDGAFFIVNRIVSGGAPYAHLLIGVFVTTLFAFVFPIIVIEKRKIFAAIGLNFKNLWGSFWYMFMVVLVPTLFYLPVLMLRSNISGLADATVPEARVLVLIISVLVTMFIDVTIYTAVTSFYLIKRERS